MPLLMLKVVAVPVEGVNVMAVGTTLKLTSPRVAGGVSATRTKLTSAVPGGGGVVVPLGKLWQAESSKAVAKVPERKDLVCVIEYPTRMNVLRPCRANCLSRTPNWDFTRKNE